jgi:uncharacterized membrane protein
LRILRECLSEFPFSGYGFRQLILSEIYAKNKNMKDFFKNLFRYKSAISQFLLILIIVYAVASINLLIVAMNWYKSMPGAFLNHYVLIVFSVISFLLVILVAAYHLSSLIRRRKRRTDQQRLSRARFVRAKHRMPPRGLR